MGVAAPGHRVISIAIASSAQRHVPEQRKRVADGSAHPACRQAAAGRETQACTLVVWLRAEVGLLKPPPLMLDSVAASLYTTAPSTAVPWASQRHDDQSSGWCVRDRWQEGSAAAGKNWTGMTKQWRTKNGGWQMPVKVVRAVSQKS